MSKILITGENSYLGNAVAERMKAAGHEVAVISVRGDGWRDCDFSQYDSVFHVAGIAHDSGKKGDAEAYYRVNTDLALEVASKAKAQGARQFIFMSSMLIYNGVKDRMITLDTVPKARGAYGDSKLRADLGVQGLADRDFKVAVVRPPMIFGKGCKGNFPRLVGLSMRLPFFPRINNRRSMLYVGNLCEFVRLLVESGEGGVYFPQNPEYFSTTEIATTIANAKGKALRTTRLFNWAIWVWYPLLSPIRKLFGSLTYDKSISAHFGNQYQQIDNKQSIEVSVEV